MRITIVTGPFLSMPPASCGAVEKLWDGLARVFVRKGHQLTVLCRAYPTQKPDETIDGVRFIRRTQFTTTGRTFPNLVKDLAYAATMTLRLPPGDICVTNTFWLPLLAALRRRRTGKIVVAVHRYPKGQMGLYRFCDRLVTPSQAMAEAIVAQTPAVRHLVHLIPNPVDTTTFRPPETPRDYTGLKTILFSGRIHPEKGIDMLVESFSRISPRFPDVRLALVGPSATDQGGGGPEYLARLQSRCNGLPVSFDPPIYDPAALAHRLQQAHFYCYPSLARTGEALPVAPLEALATGLPPIVSRLGVFDDFVIEGKTGFRFDHTAADPAGALADTLAAVIARSGEMPEIGRRAANAARRFDYDRIADEYLQDWQGLQSGQKKSA